MTDTIKVAVIGAGMMGKNHLKTYKGLNGVELVGVYDIFPEACKAAAETFGIKAFSSLEEVAENVDARQCCYHLGHSRRSWRIFLKPRHSLPDGKASGHDRSRMPETDFCRQKQ